MNYNHPYSEVVRQYVTDQTAPFFTSA